MIDPGRLVEPDDPVKLSKALEQALTSPREAQADARQLAASARHRFDVGAMADSIVAFYGQLLGRDGRQARQAGA